MDKICDCSRNAFGLLRVCDCDPPTLKPGDPDYPSTLLMCYLSGQMSEAQWQEHQQAGEV